MGALDKVRGALKSALDQVEAAAPKLISSTCAGGCHAQTLVGEVARRR